MYSINKFTTILYLMFSLLCLNLKSQDKTISSGNKAVVSANSKHKIMLIPFENRMYLSEIDFMINQDSKLNAKQIKATMRDGLNEQFYRKLKSKLTVVDLLDDTAKTKKDLENVYQYLSYQYLKVPDQTNYKPPVKDKDTKTINNGQLTVESNSDARFMNAWIKSPTVVPYLSGKYKTDLFLFFNELDIKALNGMPGDLNTNPTRKIILHYTVYTVDAREINSGIAEVSLPSNVNNPTKIINTYFAQLADIVAARIDKALLVK